ncbi:MAG TPA: hypothetical protein VFJ96_06550 [Gemmatimonadaceae bacterium]|jgi:outer membrane biosynthesis protein TonB|nr:hypothetical protein [Gemmatimonadaceae bacterium]
MDAILKTAALSLTVVALACGGKSTQSASNGMDDGLRKDLQLASSPNLELASTAREQNKRQMVVSDIERTPGMAPVRAATKAKAPPKPAAPARKPTVVEVQSPTPAPAPTPTVVAQATTETPAPDPEPSAAPRPEPPSVTYPTVPSTEGTRGRGGIGGIIGVVIRGGVMDGDHCDPRGTMGRRGGIAINNRLPTHPTFPIPR